MPIDANIVNFGQSTPTANALGNFGGAVAGAITANKQAGLSENRRQAAMKAAEAFDDDTPAERVTELKLEIASLDPEFYLELEKMLRKGQVGESSAEKAFSSLIAELSPEDQEKARRIKLGLDSRSVGSAAQTIATSGSAESVAESESIIEGSKAEAKEEGKLKAQLTGKPEVDAAVKLAISDVDSFIADSKEDKSSNKAMAVYETGIKSLTNSLEGTVTGPFVGLFPAISANAQIAEGAVSAMAPVLKKMFRESGEGTFTDSDQQMLLNMMPTRSDRPAAVAAKLENIDAIIRAKLSSSDTANKTPVINSQGWGLQVDASGNKAYVGPNGEIEEVN